MSDQVKASEFIKDAICKGGAPVSVCGFCNRINFATSGMDMDEGELEQLQANEAAHPEKYHAISQYDSVSIGEIEGTNYVWGCGCKQSEERLSRIENFLWSHQAIIATYFRRRLKAMEEEVNTRNGLSWL